MSKKIWRHSMSKSEIKLWEQDDMKGWREALERCIEDEARDEGCKKYIIQTRDKDVLVKGEVRVIVAPVVEQ